MKLPGGLVEEFRKTLEEAFDLSALGRMISTKLNQKAEDFYSGNATKIEAVKKLFEHYQNNDKLHELLEGAYDSNGTNQKLKSFYDDLYLNFKLYTHLYSISCEKLRTAIINIITASETNGDFYETKSDKFEEFLEAHCFKVLRGKQQEVINFIEVILDRCGHENRIREALANLDPRIKSDPKPRPGKNGTDRFWIYIVVSDDDNKEPKSDGKKLSTKAFFAEYKKVDPIILSDSLQDSCSFEDLKTRLGEIINAVVEQKTNLLQKFQSFNMTVEVFLPVECIDEIGDDVDRWTIQDSLGDEVCLGKEYRIVLRSSIFISKPKIFSDSYDKLKGFLALDLDERKEKIEEILLDQTGIFGDRKSSAGRDVKIQEWLKRNIKDKQGVLISIRHRSDSLPLLEEFKPSGEKLVGALLKIAKDDQKGLDDLDNILADFIDQIFNLREIAYKNEEIDEKHIGANLSFWSQLQPANRRLTLDKLKWN